MLMEGSELGNCRLVRRIGAGAMGAVYLAEQVRLGNRLVAVKVVRAEQDISLSGDATAHVERHFIREAQLLGQLTHPNILPVYHSGIEAGYLFLVMQYAPDGSLADAIKGNGPHKLVLPASLPFVVDIVGQVADALQHTHEHGVIHADVKPGNVLTQIEPNGHWHVLLADFGIAQSRDTVASRNEVAGTLSYMAPEQFYGHVSAACDQYALGVVTYQLLAGRTPFVGGFVELAQAHAHENPPSLRALNPAVPAAVEAVILRALAKQPADRYPSVAAFAEALRAAFMGASTVLDARTRGVGAALPVWHEAEASGATLRSAPPATRTERSRAAIVSPPMAQHARPTVVGIPAITRHQGRAGRRTAQGLAVIALLLIAGVAAVGLRSHIDVIGAFSSSRTGSGAGQTPTASGARAGTGPTPSPTTPYFAPPPLGPSYPPSIPTPTPKPTAVSTQEPTPPPTATVAPQPTATVSPEPPQPTATAAPQPTATVVPQPTATAAPQPSPSATASATSQPPSAPTLPALPRPIKGPP